MKDEEFSKRGYYYREVCLWHTHPAKPHLEGKRAHKETLRRNQFGVGAEIYVRNDDTARLYLGGKGLTYTTTEWKHYEDAKLKAEAAIKAAECYRKRRVALFNATDSSAMIDKDGHVKVLVHHEEFSHPNWALSWIGGRMKVRCKDVSYEMVVRDVRVLGKKGRDFLFTGQIVKELARRAWADFTCRGKIEVAHTGSKNFKLTSVPQRKQRGKMRKWKIEIRCRHCNDLEDEFSYRTDDPSEMRKVCDRLLDRAEAKLQRDLEEAERQ